MIKNKKYKYIIAIIISIIVTSGLAVLAYHTYKDDIKVFLELNELKDDTSKKYYYITNDNKRIEITISNDSDIDDIVELLKENGDLQGVKPFKILANQKGYEKDIISGTISLKGKYSINSLINALKFTKKETINFQIPENIRLIEEIIVLIEDSVGYKRGELKNYLESSDNLPLINDTTTTRFTMESLPAFFIPNTYELYSNLSIEDFMEKMNEEYQRFWSKERISKLDSLSLHLYGKSLSSIPDSLSIKMRINVSILASIIEEEQDRRIEERPLIAGLYLNRIKQKIKLQSDPTVIFANNDFTIKQVLNIHLKYESPYNTYIYSGLPPGPICIPSINSIDAVLNFENTDYIFMCGRGDGSGLHNFAKTLREHNNNKKRFKRNVGFN